MHEGNHCCAHEGCDFHIPGHSSDCPTVNGTGWNWGHNHPADSRCDPRCRLYEEPEIFEEPPLGPTFSNLFEDGHNHTRSVPCLAGCPGHVDPNAWRQQPKPDFSNLFEDGHNHSRSASCHIGCPGWLTG